ncbi:hypothetical protein, partial [Helicobacter heilmannii]|uniref:hypothetical protein n=1 Tax=Helicobacter heilmannii TaxID=35817 RepID=UPI0018D052F6
VAAGGSAAVSIATNVATLEATYQAVAGALNDAAKFEAAATGASAADKLAFTLAKVIATSGSESTYIQNWGTGTNIQNTSVSVNGQTMTLAQAITNLTAAATTSGSLPWLLSQINSSTITSSSLGTSDSTIGALITEASTLAGYVTGLSSNGVSNTTAFLSSGAGAVTDFNNSQTQLIAPQVTPTQFDNYLSGAGINVSTLSFKNTATASQMNQAIQTVQNLQADVTGAATGTTGTTLTDLSAGLSAAATAYGVVTGALATAPTFSSIPSDVTHGLSRQALLKAQMNYVIQGLIGGTIKLTGGSGSTDIATYITNWSTVKNEKVGGTGNDVSTALKNLSGSTLASGSLSAIVADLTSSYQSTNNISLSS